MMRYDSHWVQLGVVSFGNKCGEPGYPGKLKKIIFIISYVIYI